MAKIGNNNGGDGGIGGDGNRENQPRDEVETLRPQIDDRTVEETTMCIGAESLSSGGDHEGGLQEGGDDVDRRAPMEEGRMPVGLETEGPRVQHLDSRSAVEGVVITGRGSGGGPSSGSGGDIWTGLPLRDPAKGKGPIVVEEASGEVPMEPVEFRPAAESLGHRPITRGDFAKFVDEEVLACLLQENPVVVAAVLVAREKR